jgi:hypothetical protein
MNDCFQAILIAARKPLLRAYIKVVCWCLALGEVEDRLNRFESIKFQVLYKLYSLFVGAAFQPRLQ